MRFAAIAHALPSRVVTNAEVLSAVLSASATHLTAPELAALEERITGCFAAAGTTVRYHRAPGETAVGLAVEAGRRALAAADVPASSIDLLIYTGVGRGVLEPASAVIYQDELGLVNATAFDILDACASWIRAVHLADMLLAAGVHRRVMILNAEFSGTHTHRYELRSLAEFEHWHPGVTIGEAATATILDADDDIDLVTSFRTDGRHRELCFVPLPNVAGYFGTDEMASVAPPYQFVSFGTWLMNRGAGQLIEHYRESPALHAPDADLVLTHSASDLMSEHVLDACALPRDKARLFHGSFANTASACVPLAMSHLIADGELRDGARLLILVASAGITTNITRLTYRK